MSAHSDLVWVNKTRDSTSLSNCREEKDTHRQIRSRALTAGHKSSRIKRPIKRMPLLQTWDRTEVTNCVAHDAALLSSKPKRRYLGPLSSQSEHCGRSLGFHRRRDTLLHRGNRDNSGTAFQIHPLSGIPDPFSSYSINLDTAALDHLWYFENIWTQCAFKLPGCAGYGHEPIKQCEVTSMVQQSLRSGTRSYCLLAAISARIHCIHYQRAQNDDKGLSHSYAAKAIYGLRQRMQQCSTFSEEDSTDVLFLAAYEIFCFDELAADKHLAAVRRLYRGKISSIFMKRLQVNLEILVAESVENDWRQDIDRLVQSR